MSIKVMTRVWEYSQHSGSKLLALLAIADHADHDGVAWPSIPRIAQKARIGKRQAQRVVQDLADTGELYVQTGGGRGHSNLYLVAVGLEAAELQDALIRQFELSDAEALQVVAQLNGHHKKGDIDDTLSETVTSGAEKGDMPGQKGDIQDQKGVMQGTKGDIAMSPEPSWNRHENRQENRQKNHGGAQKQKQRPSPDCQLIWQSALAELQLQMTRAVFETHFAYTEALERQNGRLVIKCSNPTSREWLELRYRPMVERVLADLGVERVQFVVEDG